MNKLGLVAGQRKRNLNGGDTLIVVR